MVLGMSLPTFTLLHVVISLVGIAAGFVVVYGMLGSNRPSTWTAVFLATTVLTSMTGFLFPSRSSCRRTSSASSRWSCWRWRSSGSTSTVSRDRGAGF